MKLLPGLANFVKSRGVIDLESFKIDIYKLKRIQKTYFGKRVVQLIFKYKVKRTYYTIYSSKATFNLKSGKMSQPVFEDGYIVLRKGLKQCKIELKDANSDITNSICRHMDHFNEFVRGYNQQLVDDAKLKKEARILTQKEKLDNFLKGLDF